MSEMRLPDGWKTTKLKELMQLRRENIHPTDDPTSMYVGLEHIDTGNTQLNRWGQASDVKSAKNKFYPDDVLYGKLRPYLDKAVRAEFEGMCSTDILVFTPTSKTTSDFLVHLIHTHNFINHAISTTAGVNHPRTSWAKLKDLVIPLPPLSEQRAIAHALRTVQQARKARQRALALERERKAALMEHLFTHGIHNEPHQQTDIGEIPQSWSLVELGECIADGPQNGIYKPAKLYGEGTPIIRIDTFDNSGLFTTFDFKRVKLSSDEVNRYLVSEGDILINRVNSLSHLGKSVLIPKLLEKTVFESNMMRLHVDETKLLPEFLIRYLVTPENKERMRGKARRAVAQSSINQGDVKSLLVSVPPLSEQQEIASVLQACDDKIAVLERESVLLEELFRAMLEELMTGEIRMRDEG